MGEVAASMASAEASARASEERAASVAESAECRAAFAAIPVIAGRKWIATIVITGEAKQAVSGTLAAARRIEALAGMYADELRQCLRDGYRQISSDFGLAIDECESRYDWREYPLPTADGSTFVLLGLHPKAREGQPLDLSFPAQFAAYQDVATAEQERTGRPGYLARYDPTLND